MISLKTSAAVIAVLGLFLTTAPSTHASEVTGTLTTEIPSVTTTTIPPVPTNPAPVTGISYGGGSGGGGSITIHGSSIPFATTTPKQLVATTTGKVLGATTYYFAHDLTKGDVNQDVLALQQVLSTLGYLVIDAPTNYFGKLTRAAVVMYQKAHSLPAAGRVGQLTRAALNGG